MNPTKFSLPIQQALTSAPLDFVFLSGNGSYQINKILASTQCITIKNLLICDPSCNSYKVTTADTHGSFQDVLEFLNGNMISLNSTNIEFIRQVAVELQCSKLSDFVAPTIISNMSPSIAIQTLNKYLQQNITPASYIQMCQYELRYVAKNFENIKHSYLPELSRLPIEALDVILMVPELNVEETDILDFVYSIIEQNPNNPAYYSLFSHVLYDKIESDRARTFFDKIKTQEVSGALWLAMSRRLKCHVVSDNI
ncbi:hypothetical protein TRFO_07711 [Tritrichomonas foetus]|uniref:BTB domain-containing protein n=1 Tax=Tritrichomonas foetus TaxID=1144522 RepID=A0A1J4JU44_9EUKA|nr:hypothetical protein TRFO_07711 [Tritrichomonas foetus]|eukprot:OHT01036.1 hypothetical protein TRFO_07711 [Tritrichomonas foetus]